MLDDFLSINVEYNFSSGVEDYDEYGCIVNYNGTLYVGEYEDNDINEYCGEICFKIIYLSQAETKGLSIYDMFDTYEYTFRHAQSFYDFKKGTFRRPLLKEFPDLEFECNKICIIETIGIIPKFRGKKIGAKVFKNMVWHFGQDCQLFMLQPFPLQFEHPGNHKQLLPKLCLESLEKDKKKAIEKLSNVYQSWGFKKVKGINDLLFYCSLYQNAVFNSIDMDEG